VDTDIKKTLQTEVPTAEVRKVFLGIFLVLLPFLSLVFLSATPVHEFLFGGKRMLAYYLLLFALFARAMWRERHVIAKVERDIDAKYEGRPVLGPLHKFRRLLETIFGLATLVLFAYMIFAAFTS